MQKKKKKERKKVYALYFDFVSLDSIVYVKVFIIPTQNTSMKQ